MGYQCLEVQRSMEEGHELVEGGRAEGRMLWTDLCPFQNPRDEVLTPNVTVFGKVLSKK